MKSNKHIAWLVPGFAANENDTTCLTYLQAMLRTFKKKFPEISITIFSFQYPDEKGWYKISGTDVFSAAGKNKKGFARFLTWKTILSEVKKRHRGKSFDLIQSFWLSECALLGYRISKKYSVPHFVYLMGQDCLKQNKYHKLFRFFKLNIIAESGFASSAYFISTGEKASAIIPLGMDIDFFAVNANRERTIDIFGVGSLIPLKRYEIFVDIIAEVKKDFPLIKCELCGDGIQKEKLLQLIQKKKLDNSLTLCGSLPRKIVLEKMNQSKILLHTSSFESLGYVFLESLHCGCHLVAFETGFIPQTNQSHVCHSKNEMIETIKNLLQNKIQNESQKNFTMDDTVKSLMQLYEL